MVAAGILTRKRLISRLLWISMASWSMPMKASRGLPLPSYFDAVINEAVNEYGLTEEDIVKMATGSTSSWIRIINYAGSIIRPLPSREDGTRGIW